MGRDLGGKITIRSRNDPRTDAVRLHAADTLETLLLDKAQKLGLQRRTKIADLVEKNRAAIGRFEPAGLILDRASKGASHMPEQFTTLEDAAQTLGINASTLWRKRNTT